MAFSALKKFPKLLLLLSFLLYCPCSHSAAITSPDAPSSITTPKPCPVGCAPGVPGLHSLSTRPTSTSTYTGVYYSPEDIANLRANAEARARESPKPVYPYFEAAEPNYWEYVEHSGPWGGIDFLNLAAFPSPTDVTNEQVVEEAPEEDKMIYYTEFKEFFSGLKGLSSEFTDPAKYKTAVKEGIPLPGLTTPSPYMTIAPKAKRELEESENINVKSMEGKQYLPEENEDKMVYYTEFKNFFSGLKGFSSEFTDPAKYKTAVKEGIPLPGLATPSPVLTMAFKKRNIIPDGAWPVCGNQAYDPRLYHCEHSVHCDCEILCPILKDGTRLVPCGGRCYDNISHMCRDKRTSGPRIGTDEPQEKQSQPLGLLPPLEKSGPSDSAGQQVCNHGYERECHPPLFADNIGQVNHEIVDRSPGQQILGLNKRITIEKAQETPLEPEIDLDYWNFLFDKFQSVYGVPQEIRRQLRFHIDPQDVIGSVERADSTCPDKGPGACLRD